MFRVKFDTTSFSKILNNSVQYSNGFIEGIQLEKIIFNRFLGGYTVAALEKYIDARAKMNPQELHHVYEWNNIGNPNSRLFKFTVKATQNAITINGFFLQSKTANSENGEVFRDKANVMENQIAITITPKQSPVLIFEDNGETVFTTNSIFIEHPGGDAVANSFGNTIDTFFNSYFTSALLAPIMKDLQSANEYISSFRAGAYGGGKSLGVRAGRKYLDISGVVIE